MTPRRKVALLLIALYLLFLLDLALFQFPTSKPAANFVPFHTMVRDWSHWNREFVVNFLGNLVAFMPIGLIPPLLRPGRTRAWHVALVCFTLSAMIEVWQYGSGRRVADVDDLTLNTLGGLLGYWLWVRLGSSGAWRGGRRGGTRSSVDLAGDHPAGGQGPG
jgi:glycopeptide antibiotics resistance protein